MAFFPFFSAPTPTVVISSYDAARITIKVVFAQFLQRWKNITQKELAEALGISQHHISEMENGKRTIGKIMAKRLGAFFKTDYRIFL